MENAAVMLSPPFSRVRRLLTERAVQLVALPTLRKAPALPFS